MRLILLVCALWLTSSCGNIQYLTVSSPQAIKNKEKDLVFENDTVKITYRFNGGPGPISISVQNKSAFPVQVNWKKSAFILDGRPKSYFSGEFLLKGDLSIDSSRSIIRQASYKGQLETDEALQFLPPNSSVTKKMSVLPSGKIKNITAGKGVAKSLKSTPTQRFKYIQYRFDETNSPLLFRSFLTLQSAGGQEVFMDHHFYISEIWTSEQGPSYLPKEIRMGGDLFSL